MAVANLAGKRSTHANAACTLLPPTLPQYMFPPFSCNAPQTFADDIAALAGAERCDVIVDDVLYDVEWVRTLNNLMACGYRHKNMFVLQLRVDM